ncbi:MAG TPA: helix-turn-helix domain-containing protein [Longimicrobiaceae bacterium]|nr:helix-turn-helix domain-containing protein [Longimicrobiaceae bacterium]
MRVHTAREIGLLVRAERRAQGITQEELAERIGATRQWVRFLEGGKPRLELGLTLRALNALELNVDISLNRSGPTTGERPA